MLQRADAEGYDIEIPPVFSVALSVVPPGAPPESKVATAPPPPMMGSAPEPEPEASHEKWAAFVDIEGKSNPLPGIESGDYSQSGGEASDAVAAAAPDSAPPTAPIPQAPPSAAPAPQTSSAPVQMEPSPSETTPAGPAGTVEIAALDARRQEIEGKLQAAEAALAGLEVYRCVIFSFTVLFLFDPLSLSLSLTHTLTHSHTLTH